MHLKAGLLSATVSATETDNIDALVPIALPHDVIERQANLFALIGLFPTHELYWMHTVDGLEICEDTLLSYLNRNLDSLHQEEEEQCPNRGEYCRARANNFLLFEKKHLEPDLRLFVPDGAILEKHLDAKKRDFFHWPWIEVDADRKIRDLNESFAGIIGDTPENLRGSPLATITHHDAQGRLDEQWALRKQGVRGCYGYRYVAPSLDTFRTAWLVAWPVFDGTVFKGSFAVDIESGDNFLA